jgi:hypothetical protein
VYEALSLKLLEYEALSGHLRGNGAVTAERELLVYEALSLKLLEYEALSGHLRGNGAVTAERGEQRARRLTEARERVEPQMSVRAQL